MRVIQQRFSVPFTYNVVFTRDLFSLENPIFRDVIERNATIVPAKVVFVVDQGVQEAHPELIPAIQAYCKANDHLLKLPLAPIIVPGGEAAKNDYNLVDNLLQVVNDYAIDRQSYIVCIGGGAVLDMVGFAASIAHRGVRHIRIPTTVLSQNDSGVGVKNAVNAFGKKNFIGCFVPPVAVINDTNFLTTLEDRDWRAGIAEAIKVSLIKDAPFFESIEKEATLLVDRDPEAMEQQIFTCARLHVEHIASGDPFELGSSRPLDFGHWAAHKLEYLTDYRLRHGEAVAIGIAIDVTYSYLKEMITKKEWLRVIHLIKKLGFDLFVPELLAKQEEEYELIRGLEEFREHLGGKLTIMLLEKIGKGVEVHEMDAPLILDAIHRLKALQVQEVIFAD